ncbi:L-aspartate oxidase [Microbacterium oxydans]|uniref:L-aspartate oxidase n=1 Tax=Microbacterium oxydans TaxID=82380 RepID=UPI001D44D964|nr:L-aspartate oxidase [Microbacterium oxydans]CAH0133147.1 L-aspartate oxidase [Microbacterium oxydans]
MMQVIVVGAGIAGLTAALHAHESGHSVTIVTKGRLGDGSTRYAQGGVAGVYGPGDSAAQHAADTLVAGADLSDAAAVEVLVTDGAARIAELIARGVAFDRDADGQLLLGREAAHSHARIMHAGGDATGAAISLALADAVRSTEIRIVQDAFLLDLLRSDGAVRGIRLLIDGDERQLDADAVVLATGGAGHLYAHTTNPAGITGDGIAAALRAGAAVSDLEFMQFHPTVLAAGPTFLISEAVRGEGATLIDAAGRRFAFDAHPDGELAPRDVVSRAIARQAVAQGSPVRLDATMLGADLLARRFPTIDRVTRERGFDWAGEPIPVTPAAHYLMGGIDTDLDGRTTITGLFAVGETARTGVHGANRLASNSLLEGAVFGARAAAALGRPWPAASTAAFRSQFAPLPTPASGSNRDRNTVVEPAEFSRAALQRLMWELVGLLRTDAGLGDALATIRAWRDLVPAPRTLSEHEDANLLLLAEATTTAALARTASVGAHFRVAEPVESPTVEAPVLETV